DFPVHVCWHTGHAARQNFPALSDEFFKEIGVLVIDCFESNIDPTPWHGAIGATERRTALWRFWLHQLFSLAVQRVFPQEWIVLLFLEPLWRARALFISRGHVARRRFA